MLLFIFTELGLLVAVRSGTLGIATSPDGINWTPQTTPNNGHFQIDWSPQLGLFVVCSVGTGEPLPTPPPPNNTKIMTSPDGINWTYRSTPNNFGYRGVVWCSNLNCFVAVGASGSINQLLISFDGINWKQGTLPNSVTNRCICYSNELGIIVVGQDATNFEFLTSSLAGRPPSSYNVFDGSFNNIDQSGNWTIKAKEIYGDNLLVNSNVEISGNLDLSGDLTLNCNDISGVNSITFCGGNITTSTPNYTTKIKATNDTTETTTFLKVKINGADAWIPYFTTDPSLP